MRWVEVTLQSLPKLVDDDLNTCLGDIAGIGPCQLVFGLEEVSRGPRKNRLHHVVDGGIHEDGRPLYVEAVRRPWMAISVR